MIPSHHTNFTKRIPRLLAAIVFILMTGLILVWILFPEHKDFSGTIMKFNTSVGLLLLSLCLYGLGSRSLPSKLIRFPATLVILLGAWTLAEYGLGLPGMIDEFFVSDVRNEESALYPGRMSPISAVLFCLMGVGFFLKSFPRLAHLGFYLILPSYLLSFLSIVGYLYGHQALYQYGSYIRIGWVTSLCFNLLATGVFFLRHRNVTSVLTSTGPGGLIARRLLPLVIFLPITLGYLLIAARERQWVDRELGISLYTLITVSVLIVMISIIARRLDQLDNERRELEAETEAGRRKFLQVLESSPLIVWSVTREGTFTFCEGAALKQLGATPEDFLGKDVFKIEEANSTSLDHIRRALRGESFFAETQFGNRNYSSHYSPIFESDHSVSGVTVISLDITELRNAENSYLMERVNFRELFRHTPLVFGVFTGPELVFEFVNESLIALFKFDPTGMKVREARPDSKGMLAALAQVYATGEPMNLSEIKVPSGEEFRIFNMTISPRRDAQGNIEGLLFLGLDVTNLVEARDSLKKAVDARDEFLSVASHELKTPITSFQLQLQVMDKLRKANDPRTYDPARVDSLLSLGTRQLHRINRLVEDMLDISRINSGKLTFRMANESLSDTVRDVAARLKFIFDESGTSLETDIAEGVEARMDRVRIEQVLSNVLTNAHRYGEKRPVTVRLKRGREEAVVEIQDQGMGIGKEDLERIFGRFERGISNSEVSGLGLGLYISRQIVEAHGGTISAESAGAGAGTTVRIQLPLQK